MSKGLDVCRRFPRTAKNTMKNSLGALCLSGVALAGSAIAASAQTTPVPLVFSTADGGSGSTRLTGLPTTATSDATLALDFFGDLDFSGETLAVSLDGVLVGTLGGIRQCSPTRPPANTSITIPQATLAPLVTDGQVVVSYQATASVNNFCSALLGAPAGTSFGASGSLTYTGSTPGAGGAGNQASNSIARFLEGRARALVQNQPDVVRFVDGRAAGSFGGDVTRNAGAVDLQTGAVGPFWVALQGSWTDSSFGDQSYFLGSFGAHTYLGSNTIIGAMVQFDHADRSETGIADTSGNGWLAGPYFASQLGSQPLFMDGRLLYGQTSNEITPSGAPTDDFDGDRWLAMLGLEGRVQANGLTIFPGLDVSYVEDGQDAFVDSTATSVPSQSVEQTEVALNLDFETPIPTDKGAMVLTWGVAGIWSNTDGSGPSASIVQFDNGWRGRFDLGYRFENGKGWKSDANAFVDGLGEGYESFGLSAVVSYTF